MAHPTEWWLQQGKEDKHQRAYQSIDDPVESLERNDSNNHQDEEGSTSKTNPLHDFLNNTILSYKRQSTEDDSASQGSEVRSSISSRSSLDSQIEPPHKTLSVLFFDVIRFIAINADCRLISTELMPMVWSGVGKTVRYGIRHGTVSGMSDEKMEILHVALRMFMALMALLLLLIEFPDTFPILQMGPQNPPLTLYNWIPRGIFCVFLSVICFEQEIVVRALDMDQHYSTSSRFFDTIPIVLAAWFMLISGVMYILLGMCCLQRVMERVRAEEKEAWVEYYEHLRLLDMEECEEEEREWLLENEERNGCCWFCGCCNTWSQGCQRWYRRYQRRRRRGEGFCSIMGCRALECR